MPSHLRLQSSFVPVEANAIYQHSSPTSPPAKKQKMSLTSTYYIASTARSKLGREAGRPDHNLRLLVGHANLLDGLMENLASAEREQEAWFNQSVKKASKPEEPRHVQWIDTIAEEEEADDSDSDSDAGSDVYDEDMELFEMQSAPLRKMRSPPVTISSADLEDDEDDDEFDDEEYDELHALSRVASHSPPELFHDSDSESEDDMPPSPEQPMLEFDEKSQQQIMSTNPAFFQQHSTKPQSGMDSYMQAPMIQAC